MSGGSFADVADAIVDTANGKLYLLSTEEVQALSKSMLQMTFSCDYGAWWLRSPGEKSGCVAFVYGDDVFPDSDGYDVDEQLGIRPALKLDLSAVVFSSAEKAFTLKPAGYSVTVTPGSHVTRKSDSGAESQTKLTGEMTPVVYTADDGYYFPENYSVAAVSGISAVRNSSAQITVSGTPTADAAITLPASSEKMKPDAPSTAAAVDCTSTDNNDGKPTGVTAEMEYKSRTPTAGRPEPETTLPVLFPENIMCA